MREMEISSEGEVKNKRQMDGYFNARGACEMRTRHHPREEMTERAKDETAGECAGDYATSTNDPLTNTLTQASERQ